MSTTKPIDALATGNGHNLVNAARPKLQAIVTETERTVAQFQESVQHNMLLQAFLAGYQHRMEIEKAERDEAAATKSDDDFPVG